MRIAKNSSRPLLLVLINWLLFFAGFIATCKVQGNARWWLNLNWKTWLADLVDTTELGVIPAGSIWIGWLVLSSIFTLIWITGRAKKLTPEPAGEAATTQELPANTDMMETHPGLKEKILRLHQSLDKI